MTLYLLLAVVMLLVIALAETLGERTGIVAPIILLVASAAVSLFTPLPDIEIEPDLILEVILPPLLFATAMRMPAHDFRRNFAPISVLAVVLVVVTAFAVGLTIHAVLPEVPLAYAVAVGAVMSPSDAVATGIVKQAGVSSRVIAILDGEGLINDASALVMLRSALLAATVGASTEQVVGDFAWAVAGAILCGMLVGHLMMWLRKHVHGVTANTVISLAIPFAAFLPAEHLGASGLVATVVAGLVVAHHSVEKLGPAQRMNERQTWATVGLILESAVSLLMGLQVPRLLEDAAEAGYTLASALGIGALAIVVIMVVRAFVVTPLLRWLRWRARRNPDYIERLDEFDKALEEMTTPSEHTLARARRRSERARADVRYSEESQLSWREGVVNIWSGMRGAVTLAAAQTIPEGTPARSFLILLAFVVAAASLILQGGTLGWLVTTVKPAPDVPSSREERLELRRALYDAACSVPVPPVLGQALCDGGDVSEKRIHQMPLTDLIRLVRKAITSGHLGDELHKEINAYVLERIRAKRELLLVERDAGRVRASDFDYHLSQLDAQQMVIELQG